MSDPRWEAALAGLEAHVGDLEAVAADPRELDRFGDTGVPPFVPPADLGPVPVALRDRAGSLSIRMVEVESALAAALDGIRTELAATQRFTGPDTAAEAPSYYLDTTA